jgi:hypothetical protein
MSGKKYKQGDKVLNHITRNYVAKYAFKITDIVKKTLPMHHSAAMPAWLDVRMEFM